MATSLKHNLPGHERSIKMTNLSDKSHKYCYNGALAEQIEKRWQDSWDRAKIYEVPNPVGLLADETTRGRVEKLFIGDMFPTPSGPELHVGHQLGYIATDVFARYHRMLGKTVLHTMGFDAFGLMTEQYAVQTDAHPQQTSEENIANMRCQLRKLGLGHDRRRSVITSDPTFYRWTQWIFLKIYDSYYDAAQNKARPISILESEFSSGKRQLPDQRTWSALSSHERAEVIDSYRLAYRAEVPGYWCPALGTTLSDEEVTNEKSQLGNFPVFRIKSHQWMMRITAYAERLLEDLELLDWPEAIKRKQRDWIGRSVGIDVKFAVGEHVITVFTDRPESLFMLPA